MNAYDWLGNDGYQYLVAFTEAEAAEVISRFGPQAKAPALHWEDGFKLFCYIINPTEKIITPIRYLSWVFGGHVDEPLVGEERSVALFLDQYRFEEYPFQR